MKKSKVIKISVKQWREIKEKVGDLYRIILNGCRGNTERIDQIKKEEREFAEFLNGVENESN